MTKNNLPKIDFAVGGQAVIEGVMMRSPNYTVVSVRRENGDIVENQEFYQQITHRVKALNLPIVRGIINLFEMLYIGTKALTFSSKQAMEDLDDTPQKKPKEKSKQLENLTLTLSIIVSLGLSIFLFKFIPLWFTEFLSTRNAIIDNNYILFNLIDGITKTSLFILYIWLLSFLPDLRRVFQYHGAEHKSIMTYEAGDKLTVANAKKQSRFHPRCGTSFILIVFLFSILIYTFIPRHPDFLINFTIRLLSLPLIAGISYEFLKLTAKYSHLKSVSWLTAPGLWMQRLTTKEPDDQMLAVALNSLQLSLNLENKYQDEQIVP